MLNTNHIRKEFPIYQEREGLVYLDSASTTQKPQCVIDSVSSFYSNYNANVHRALYEIGEKATNEFESVRLKIKKFLFVLRIVFIKIVMDHTLVLSAHS